MPRVSVLMPVYNGEEFIGEAINSILCQSFSDFELIILNDGSMDKSKEAIESFSDSRILYIEHENMGLAKTLNKGIAIARGEYVARLDQDDIALPLRLEKQVGFLDNNPYVGLLGTWAEIFCDGVPSTRFHKHPTNHDEIVAHLMLNNPFVHSSIMLRKSVCIDVGCYSEDTERQPPEDYEYWSRISRATKLANLGEVLVRYRETPASMSRTPSERFMRVVANCAAENLFLFSKSKESAFFDILQFQYFRFGLINDGEFKKSCKLKTVQNSIKRAFRMLKTRNQIIEMAKADLLGTVNSFKKTGVLRRLYRKVKRVLRVG